MKEIDNRYPEFAAPYEPIRGGRRHKRLDFARMAMMLAGALVACSAFFKVPEPEPMPGPVIVVPSAEPTPEPTASPTVEPEPSPSPTAIPYIPPKPPAPTPTTVPVTPPTPRPADPTPTPTTVPPETPTPGPTEEPVEDDVFVEIIGNQATYAYTGEEQFVRGYTYTVYVNGEEADSSLFTVTYRATDDMTYPYAAGIEPGTYEMGLTEDSFTVSSGTYDLFGYAVEDGWLKIIDESEELNVYIYGNTSSVTYDGQAHTVSGFTYEAEDSSGAVDSSLYTVALKEGSAAQASGTYAGTYPLLTGIVDLQQTTAEDFEVTSDVYTSINVIYENGWLRIEPVTTTITVTGNTGTYTYQAGSIFNVTGYTVEIPTGIDLTEADIVFSGTAAVSSGEVGRYPMGLDADQFSLTGDAAVNYNATFAVTDGWLQINESGSSETHTAPDVTALGASNFFGTSADPISYVDGRITLKEDLNAPGASGTAGLYRVDGTDVYTLVSNEISYTYGTSTSTDGTIPLEFEYHHPASGANFNQDQFIIRFNYTFPDGTTGTKDTRVFHLYNPGFLGTPTYTWNGDTLTISAEIIFRNLMPNYSQKIHPHQYESGNWLLLTREDGTLVNVTPTFSVESVDYGAKDLVTVTYDLSGEAADETYDFEGVFDYLMYEDEPNFPWQAKVNLTDIHQ